MADHSGPVGAVTDAPSDALSSPGDESVLRELAARATTGDRAALEQLLERVRPIALRYCRARLGRLHGLHDADDAAQEVCIAVLRSLPAYRDEGRPFEAFVYRVAASKVVDARRRSGRDAVPTDTVPEAEDAGRGPEDTVLLREDADRVRDLMDRLPERQREVLELRVAVGMTAEETGRVLGMSLGAVRVTQHRALARLRTMVAEVPA